MALRQLVVQRLCLIGTRLIWNLVIWPRVAFCEVLIGWYLGPCKSSSKLLKPHAHAGLAPGWHKFPPAFGRIYRSERRKWRPCSAPLVRPAAEAEAQLANRLDPLPHPTPLHPPLDRR